MFLLASSTAVPAARPATTPIQDLRQWLARVERIGELVRVRQPVARRRRAQLMIS